MATSTTSSIWRSTGGDTTRTASAGSMEMVQPFYIANVAVSSNVAAAANVTSGLSNAAVILPAGAIIDTIVFTVAGGTGTVDLGFTPLVGVGPGQVGTLGTNVPSAYLAGAVSSARATFVTGGANVGTTTGAIANATNLVVLTSAANSATTGSVTGFIKYFVPTGGQENV